MATRGGFRLIRLLLRDTGLPRPVTDLTITDGRHGGRIGMGWEKVKLGVSLFEPPRPGGSSVRDEYWRRRRRRA
jgi:hypothetical protein